LAATVLIPQPLRPLTGDQPTVDGVTGSLSDCIADLEARFPGVAERMLDEEGELRRFVNVYINGEDVRFEDGLATTINDGDEVSIVPAVAGGSF